MAGTPFASSARLWLAAFAAGFAVISSLLAVTVLTPVPYGDLSRTGLLSEREFGWTRPQPQVAAALLENSALSDADVLVVGDSFSMSRRWQSVLVRDGWRVATVSWAEIGESLCQDFSDWLAEAGFRGRLVIVESVERSMRVRARSSAACGRMKRLPAAVRVAARHDPREPSSGFTGNWDARLMDGVRTWRYTQLAVQGDGDVLAAADTLVATVPHGCRQFSHRLCGRALFLGEDLRNGELDAGDAERLAAVTRAARVPLLWMVMPNKTTVYRDQARSHAFRERFNAAGLGPDLFEFSFEQRTKILDFYFPNDTHLSMRGELVVGERMRNVVRMRLQPVLTHRSP